MSVLTEYGAMSNKVKRLKMLVLLAALVVVAVQANDLDVNVDDIVRLNQQGISEQTLLVFLEKRSLSVPLSVNAIDTLLANNVSEKVIRYLISQEPVLPTAAHSDSHFAKNNVETEPLVESSAAYNVNVFPRYYSPYYYDLPYSFIDHDYGVYSFGLGLHGWNLYAGSHSGFGIGFGFWNQPYNLYQNNDGFSHNRTWGDVSHNANAGGHGLLNGVHESSGARHYNARPSLHNGAAAGHRLNGQGASHSSGGTFSGVSAGHALSSGGGGAGHNGGSGGHSGTAGHASSGGGRH
jgi:hypothetical protein